MLTNALHIILLFFHRLENVELPYNAFAFRHDRVTGEGLLDKCILYKAKATVVNLADIAPGVAWEPVPTPIPLNPDRKNKWQKTHHEKDVHAPADPSAGTENDVKNEGSNVDTASTAVNGEQGTTKDSAEGSAQGTAFVEDTTQKGKGGVAADGDVDDQEDEAFSLARVGRNGALPGYDKSIEVPGGAEIPAICIELVGNRFLRRMVRILTVSLAVYSISEVLKWLHCQFVTFFFVFACSWLFCVILCVSDFILPGQRCA